VLVAHCSRQTGLLKLALFPVGQNTTYWLYVHFESEMLRSISLTSNPNYDMTVSRGLMEAMTMPVLCDSCVGLFDTLKGSRPSYSETLPLRLSGVFAMIRAGRRMRGR